MLCLLAARPAYACIDFAEPIDADILYADSIFTGNVTGYDIVTTDQDRDLAYYAIITVKTDQFLRGDASKEVKIYWKNSTFNLPDSLLVPQKVIIAAISPVNLTPPWRAGGEMVARSDRPEILQLLQAPCSAPFMLPASVESIALIESWLEGTTQPIEGALLWRATSYDEIPDGSTLQPFFGWKGIAMVLALIVALGASVLMRRPGDET